jgi:hypothetical protein
VLGDWFAWVAIALLAFGCCRWYACAAVVRTEIQPGASVSQVAQANGVNANLVFKWPSGIRAR